jgi:16S rRNA (cytosine967-C5)-methyltransferase
MQGKYDFAISQFSDRPIAEIDGKLLDLIRLGAHQIFSMRTPSHAAINETVEVGKKVVGKSRSSFLNAMLRKLLLITNIDEYIDEKVKDPVEKLSIKYSHPIWIVRAFYDRLGDWSEVESLLAADNVAAKPNLIAWPGLSTKEELLTSGGSEIEFVSNGVIADTPPDSIKAIKERRAGVQDAGSQYLTELFLATQESENLEWLDLCAAPGGKAKYIYESLNHKRFTANEINSSRYGLLKQVLPSQVLLNLDGRESDEFPKKYDRILIDAPCTGLGALRRRPEARWRKSMNDLKELIKIQRELIDSAVKLLNPGGIIAYATCSPHLLETRVQVADALHRHKQLEILPLATLDIKSQKGLESDGTMQLWTHRDQTDSMFLALLKATK